MYQKIINNEISFEELKNDMDILLLNKDHTEDKNKVVLGIIKLISELQLCIQNKNKEDTTKTIKKILGILLILEKSKFFNELEVLKKIEKNLTSKYMIEKEEMAQIILDFKEEEKYFSSILSEALKNMEE
jgi:hypothetical protein